MDQNVPAENKDLFEHFVYMALQNDSTKQKAFALNLLRQIKLDEMVKTDPKGQATYTNLRQKVLRLIMTATDKPNVQNAALQLLKKTTGIVLFIDSQHNFIVGDSSTYPKKNRPLIKIHIMNSSTKKLIFNKIT